MEMLVTIANNILQTWQHLIVWLLGFALAFAVLYRLTPCNTSQHFQKRSFITNMAYYFIMPFFGRIVSGIYTGLGVLLFFRSVPQDEIFQAFKTGYGPMAAMPIWLQAAIIFIVSDIFLYWAHRSFHTSKLWPFHAVHHSSTQVDWHSTYRFHPVNVWLTFTLVDIIMMFAGFSLEAVTLMGAFNAMYSAMVHANLNWSFGPFKTIFASPVFHRWHHTTQAQGLNKNFAPTFPLLDIVFGTYYMPEGELPQSYGITGNPVPEKFIDQLFYPLRKKES